MKIGFLRFNLPIEIYLPSASVTKLGTEFRYGLLHDWIELGYEVNIYSEVVKRDVNLINGKSLLAKKPENKWMQELNYRFGEYPRDEDVLFIECGPTNTLFSGVEPYILHTAKILDKYEGRVIYWQHDGKLGFPFGEVFKVKRMSKEEIAKYGPTHFPHIFGNYDVLKNKEWKILHSALNEEKFLKEVHVRDGTTYYDFRDILEFEFIPPGHSDINPWFDVRENPKWDCMFVGGEFSGSVNSGSKKISRFEDIKTFCDREGIKFALIGKWNNETVAKFKYISYLGRIGTHGDVYSFYNDSYTCLWVQGKMYNEIGWIVPRPIDALRGGAIPLADEKIYGIDKFYDKRFVVTPDNIIDKIEEIKSLNPEDRNELRLKLIKHFPTWLDMDWDKLLN